MDFSLFIVGEREERWLLYTSKALCCLEKLGGEMPWHSQDGEDFSSVHEWLQKTIQPALGVKNGLNFVLGNSEGHSVFYRARPIHRRESSPIVPWAPLFIFVSIWNQNHKTACRAVALLFLLNENSSFYANSVSGFFEPAVYGPLLKTAICSA